MFCLCVLIPKYVLMKLFQSFLLKKSIHKLLHFHLHRNPETRVHTHNSEVELWTVVGTLAADHTRGRGH